MKIIEFEEIDSTNKYIKENYKTLDNFSFVSAKYQTSGKGREERNWLSKKDENLLFSLLISNQNLVKKYKILSIGVATLIARFLELKGLENVSIKWPNDVYVNDKKICGILLEGEVPTYLVIGVGININQTMFDGDYRIEPTSIKNETKNDVNISEFKDELFAFILKHIVQKEFKTKTKKFLVNHNYLLGKKVSINNVIGIVNGFDEEFNLLINNNPVNSGEINIIK